MINTIAKSLLISGLLSSVILVIVLIIRKIFDDKVSIKFINVIWILVLIRLLMPFTIDIPLYIRDIFVSEKAKNETVFAYKPESIDEYLADEPKEDTLPSAANTISSEARQPSALQSFLWNINNMSIALTLWILGAASVLIYTTVRIGIFKRRIAQQEICNDKRTYRLMEKHRKMLKIDKKITMRECKHIEVPVIIGIKSPNLLIPKGFLNRLDDNSLSMIILHEMCHIKSKDILKNYLWLLAKALNWYNPLVWIGYHKFLDDMEKHCDSLVLSHLDSETKADYFEALLNVIKLAKNTKATASLLCFCRDKSKLRKRVDIMIKSQKPIRKINILIALIMTITLFACFTTACTGKTSASDTMPSGNETESAPQPTFYNADEDESLLDVPMPTPTIENIPTASPSPDDTLIYNGNNPLSREQLEKCEKLIIQNVKNLDFLKDLENIKSISVISGTSSGVRGDIAVLGTMSNLESIRLGRTNIYGDIDSLKNLQKLQWLFLNGTKVTGDISSLENLKFLKQLGISETEVHGDIAVLKNMMYIETISLEESGVSGDIQVLKSCKLLHEVYMGSTQVTGDIAVFADNFYLEWLALEGSKVYGDVSSFSNCLNLRVIYLSGTEVEGDLSTLQDLPNLAQVQFSGTNVFGELHIPSERAMG